MRWISRRMAVVAALLVVSCLATACAPNRPYQDGHVPAIAPTDDGGVPVYAIEFDDQGSMWAPKQLFGTIDAIRRFGNQHILVITFIHGWKHNASSDDDNLLAFEQELRTRKRLEAEWATKMGTPPRPLLGIYVGWRGKTLSVDPWGISANVTFWNRKSAADRVGSTSLTEAIFSVAKATKDLNPDSQVVVIGHSFGGAILERAVAQALVALLNQPAKPGVRVETFRPSIDLAVLVNPASSALEARQLIETLMRREVLVRKAGPGNAARGFDKYGPPIIVSVTAHNDWATGHAFPLGQYPLSITKSFAPLEKGPGERELFTHTGGHTPFLNSHVLRPAPPNADDGLVFGGGAGTPYALVRAEGGWNVSPYWILRVPRDVIDGHNGIFTRAFGDLLETILDVSLVSAPQTEGAAIQANAAPRDK